VVLINDVSASTSKSKNREILNLAHYGHNLAHNGHIDKFNQRSD